MRLHILKKSEIGVFLLSIFDKIILGFCYVLSFLYFLFFSLFIFWGFILELGPCFLGHFHVADVGICWIVEVTLTHP